MGRCGAADAFSNDDIYGFLQPKTGTQPPSHAQTIARSCISVYQELKNVISQENSRPCEISYEWSTSIYTIIHYYTLTPIFIKPHITHITSLNMDSQANLDPSRLNPETASLSSLGSGSSAPPPYSDAGDIESASFIPTTHLQIHTPGVGSCAALSAQAPIPIPVFRVSPSDHLSFPAVPAGEPVYVSHRLKKNSNSCALVRGSDLDGSAPLNATIYRWGPGRCPRIRIFPSSSLSIGDPAIPHSVEEAIQSDELKCDLIDVKSRSLISRTQRMVTPLGTFQWRYAGRSERKAETEIALDTQNSLLVLEKIDEDVDKDQWAGPSSSTNYIKGKKRYTRVAQLVRNDGLRSAGSSRWSAGNGGRLMIDSRMWSSNVKGDVVGDKVEPFVVAGCICMLKREVDRERDNTIAAVT